MKINEYGGGQPRNFVKKNIQKTGSGKHRDKKNDYKRKVKHKKDLRNER